MQVAPTAGSVHNTTDYQQVILLFDEAVPATPEHHVVLVMEYSYTLQEGLDGFYRSTYQGMSLLEAAWGLLCMNHANR